MNQELEKNWLEKACFGFSMLLVTGVVFYLAYDAWSTTDLPARVAFRLDPPEMRQEQFVIRVTAINEGERTAEGVRVEVLLSMDKTEERGEFLIDYLPRHGTREGYVTFNSDPTAPGAQLKARAVGYTQPQWGI